MNFVMILVKVFITIMLLATCSAHAGEIPAARVAKASALPKSYQTGPSYPQGMADQDTAKSAIGAVEDAVQGWLDAFVGVGVRVSVEPQEADDELSCFANATAVTDTRPDPSTEDDGDFEWTIWSPRDEELSPVIFAKIPSSDGVETNLHSVDLAEMPVPELEINPLSADLAEIPSAEAEIDQPAQCNVKEDAHLMCILSDITNEDTLGNLTNDAIDDVTPFQPNTNWQTIAAWTEGFLTHLVIEYVTSSQDKIKARPPYSSTMPMTSFTGEGRPRDGFVTVDLRGEIRPGEVFLENPPAPAAWATRTIGLALACVIMCLLSPVCFTGDEQKKEARVNKALKRRKGNEHRRSGRRYAAYMNARGRD